MKTHEHGLWFLVISLLMFWGCEHEIPSGVELPPEPDDQMQLEDFYLPEVCASCHPNHYEEWRGSMHSYAPVDPVFINMQRLGQQETTNQLDQFCVQCHSPIISKLGLSPPGYDNSDLPPLGLRGVSCMACHTMVQVNATKNAEFELNPHAGIAGPIEDPVATAFHQSRYSVLFDNSELCGSCHNVVNPREVTIEATFDEWKKGPAAQLGLQCSSCHMPTYRGRAAVDGPEREVHRHFFVGVDVALIDFPDRDRQLQMVRELLRSAADIEVTVPNTVDRGGLLPIRVTVKSQTAGHHLPSGAVADRQMWLAVTATDVATGQILYQSGHLDDNGDLMDRHSELQPNADFDLVVFNQQMVGNDGQDVFFSWQAYSERTVTLPPLASVTPEYLVLLPQDIVGPLHVDVRLKFRTFPPFLLRKLNLPDLAAKIPIVDMDEWYREIEVN